MQVDDKHHLMGTLSRTSNHFDARSLGARVELVVIHCISLPEGQFDTGAPQRLFTGTLDTEENPAFADLQDVQVAPHLMIDRQGGLLQFVAFDQRAWHAGLSRWSHRSGCNDFSIGIELEGDVASPFTAVQYDVLAEVLSALLRAYPELSVDRIVGHNEIAAGRKQDPGPFFDWPGLLTRVATNSTNSG